MIVDIQQMRYYIQIYQEKSLTKAAGKLYVSQQGLSKIIRNMEKEYHVILFERSAKGLIPTEKGKILFQKCKNIIREYDELMILLQDEQIVKGETIRVGIAGFIDSSEISDAVMNFQENNPGISLEVMRLGYYDLERYLVNDFIDFCLTIKPDDTKIFHFTPVFHCGFQAYVNRKNPLHDKKKLYLKDLKTENLILMSSDTKIRTIIGQRFVKEDCSPNVTLSTSQMEMIVRYLQTNRAVAVLPDIAIRKNGKGMEDIFKLPLVGLENVLEIGFVMNKNKHLNQSERLLLDYLSRYAKEKIETEERK